MNKFQSICISILLATTLASSQAYSYSIYDDEEFGSEEAEKIKAGYYYVIQDTVFFKMRNIKKIHPFDKEYKDYDHKPIKAGQRVYLLSANYSSVAQIRTKSGNKLYIQLKDVATKKEYEAMLEEKINAQRIQNKWNAVKKTLQPCPRQGNACAIENTPAFKYRIDIINYLSIKNNNKLRLAFVKNQAQKAAIAILKPAEIINVISWEESDDHQFVKLVSETGDVLYADPTHLRALPKK